jgi:hypothetical protein
MRRVEGSDPPVYVCGVTEYEARRAAGAFFHHVRTRGRLPLLKELQAALGLRSMGALYDRLAWAADLGLLVHRPNAGWFPAEPIGLPDEQRRAS